MTRLALPAALVGLAACGPSDRAATDTATASLTVSAGVAAAEITSPADGDSVSLPLTVRLAASGVEVVPATGQAEPGKGHHHLIIDGDVPEDSLPLPKPPIAIHLGNGASEFTLDTLAPGSHRIIAVFASGDHVPMRSVRRDTITVTVR
jgi:hypothetical protein